ncbi:hypothetical protein PK69_17865 [Xanthomonas phaseoli pv. phaseoli]|uniref:DUF3592 domain-containing protein n=1 Tax=Xanthomonas campestris pv. phaseoli TaxID=317013 RepID=A0AB38E3K6_XANCH|nr:MULTISPECIES: hypothetical protein [Xanthomonas]ATS22878.1 hypothetical protein XppCFBP412P_16600 [Xanthomonas phaseoli pv. phaseoli]ATS25784.1 hypothetical protein XppCFBP6164P_09585 [Xanthomonas phaseoli pv. phaseoli]ATS30715.1 hypothetical protein XppCFBP6546P_14135 [Xanthomonas phaseoli pv. phaseoli]ATS34035.1 hypothetical protein XppCFBP6982P_09010 [Xanthomonas phaseoli pv. phaseoli]AZU15023.1 hypothetical protein AC609_20550 [Xanthomonas phaseoli pv. phaseoli]
MNATVTIVAWSFLLAGLGLLTGAALLPDQARWILLLLGVVFGGVGGGILGYRVWHARRAAWLRQHGMVVEARFVCVERNASLQVNGVHPFRILAHRHDRAHNTLTEYRSDNLWTDPQPFLRDGQSLRIFVDPQRPSRYHIDLSFLPTLRS